MDLLPATNQPFNPIPGPGPGRYKSFKKDPILEPR